MNSSTTPSPVLPKAPHATATPDWRLRDALTGLIDRFEAEQQATLGQAAEWMANACAEDRLIYLFGGGGHTCLVMQELFWRAGGLANLCPMLDFAIHPATPAYLYLGHERMHDVGNHVVDYYGVKQGDLVLLFHSYGFNAPTIDAALESKRRGAKVVAISSSDWHRSVPRDFPIRHRSGKTLFDIADVCIDDYVPYGDTVIQVDGFPQPITGISSTIDFYIAHRLEMECVKACVRRGVVAPVWRSANIPGGDAYNAKLREKYNPRVKLL
ncbi:MAG: sugar isomerase domain-containing protein [Opitutae bacterium]|nr:sugar isomerase domain-containing protein [Opitutae bacterium]